MLKLPRYPDIIFEKLYIFAECQRKVWDNAWNCLLKDENINIIIIAIREQMFESSENVGFFKNSKIT